jgi:hypothetical protein
MRDMSAISFKYGRGRSFIVLAALSLLLLSQQKTSGQTATSLTLEDKPLHYSLPEGETTLIIQISKASLLDHFTFINEETVRGALKIAVAASRLSAADPNWNAVSGDIAFAHKRLFNLSMVGVDAQYVKLSFRVTKEDRIAELGR